MTTVVIDSQRTVTVNDQGIITRVTVNQAGVQGPQGDPTTVNGKTGSSITLTASDVGAIPTTARGADNGVAELDGSGLVPLAELPVAGLAGDFVDLSTNQTIVTGIKTFSVSPVVPTPMTSTQAANKGYSDLHLPLAGGTMTGAIVLPGNPSTSLQAAPKQYADLMLPLTGGTMSGAINAGSNKITNLTNGSSAQDAVTFVQLPSSTNLLPIASGGTGSTTKSFVDLTTGQTVAGIKAFSSSPTGPTPVGYTDLANKGYVDAIAQGLNPKPSAALATAAALPSNTYNNGASGVGATLIGVATGVLTVDGTAVTLNMTLLVKNEVASANNGLYTCTTAGAVGVAYILTRSTSMNTAAEIPGAYSYVESGTTNGDSLWAVVGAGPFTIGTTAIPYTQISGPGAVSAGTGLTLTGSVMSLTNPVSVALGGTGSATQNFVDLSTTQAAIAGAKTFTGLLTGTARIRATSTGAASGTGGYMGQVAGAAPASGTFVVGDFVIDGTLGIIWTCITAGTPGTWMPTRSSFKTQILGGTAANIAFSSIPAFNHIRVTWKLRCSAAATLEPLQVTLNGDTASHYLWQDIEAITTGAATGGTPAALQTSILAGEIAGASATAKYYSAGSFEIPYWSDTTNFATLIGSGANPITTSNANIGVYSGLYNQAATLTSLTLTPASGTLNVGSMATLEGWM